METWGERGRKSPSYQLSSLGCHSVGFQDLGASALTQPLLDSGILLSTLVVIVVVVVGKRFSTQVVVVVVVVVITR